MPIGPSDPLLGILLGTAGWGSLPVPWWGHATRAGIGDQGSLLSGRRVHIVPVSIWGLCLGRGSLSSSGFPPVTHRILARGYPLLGFLLTTLALVVASAHFHARAITYCLGMGESGGSPKGPSATPLILYLG